MTHSFTTKGSRRYRYYVCVNAQKQGWKSCPTKSVPASEIERFVVDQIHCIGRDPGLVAETLAEVARRADEGQERAVSERAATERDLGRFQRALRTATDPEHRADLGERIDTAERRIRELGAEIDGLRDAVVSEEEIRAALADFDVLWDILTPREQVRMIELLIERVEFDGDEGTVSVTFNPTGIRALEQHDGEAAA